LPRLRVQQYMARPHRARRVGLAPFQSPGGERAPVSCVRSLASCDPDRVWGGQIEVTSAEASSPQWER
jgi:hypothetical protein